MKTVTNMMKKVVQTSKMMIVMKTRAAVDYNEERYAN